MWRPGDQIKEVTVKRLHDGIDETFVLSLRERAMRKRVGIHSLGVSSSTGRRMQRARLAAYRPTATLRVWLADPYTSIADTMVQ
jgi:hypothetical protein